MGAAAAFLLPCSRRPCSRAWRARVVPRPRGRGLTAPRSTFDQSVGDDDSTLSFMAARAPSAGDDAAAAIAAQLGFAVAPPQPAAARAAAPAQLTPAPPGLPAPARAPPPLELQLAFEREGHCVTRAAARRVGDRRVRARGARRGARGERGARAHAADVNAPGNAPPFCRRSTRTARTARSPRSRRRRGSARPRRRCSARRAAAVPDGRVHEAAAGRGDAVAQRPAHLAADERHGHVLARALHAVPSPDDGGSALVLGAQPPRPRARDARRRRRGRAARRALLLRRRAVRRRDRATTRARRGGRRDVAPRLVPAPASALDGGAREERVALALTTSRTRAHALDAAGPR